MFLSEAIPSQGELLESMQVRKFAVQMINTMHIA